MRAIRQLENVAAFVSYQACSVTATKAPRAARIAAPRTSPKRLYRRSSFVTAVIHRSI